MRGVRQNRTPLIRRRRQRYKLIYWQQVAINMHIGDTSRQRAQFSHDSINMLVTMSW